MTIRQTRSKEVDGLVPALWGGSRRPGSGPQPYVPTREGGTIPPVPRLDKTIKEPTRLRGR